MTTAARSIAATTLLLALASAFVAAEPAGAAQTQSSASAVPAAATPKPALTATALSASASATPQVQPPPAEPQKLVLQAATAPGGEGAPGMARGEGKVAKDRPAAFLFQPEVGGLFSIGVSSPQSAARITIYLGEATQPEASTSQADGAIRWSTSLESGARVKIVVHTAGEEIPFRVEVIAGPGSL